MTFPQTSSSYFPQETLAVLVEHYQELRCDLDATTDREQQQLKLLRLDRCLDAIWRALPTGPTAQQLATLVKVYQIFHHEQRAVGRDSGQQEQLRDYLRGTCDRIWTVLAEPLTRLAYGWLRSLLAQNLFQNPASYDGKADVVQALALSAFADVIAQLPVLRIDPQQKVLALLLTIARRGLYAQNGDYLPSRPPTARTDPTPPGSIVSGSEEAMMWPDAEPAAEPAQDDFKSDVETRAYAQQGASALGDFIARTFGPIDQAILRSRWRTEPPVDFAAIAAELGPEWDATRVRVRYHRALEHMRTYVESRIVAAMRDVCCATEVWTLVRRALEPVDETILQIRWRTEPPADFAVIAVALGPGWTTPQVRERHHRAMAQIFAHLRSLGLVDLG